MRMVILSISMYNVYKKYICILSIDITYQIQTQDNEKMLI